jgi:hypothetical protein
MQGPASEREKEKQKRGEREKGREKADSTNIILAGDESIGHKLQKE